MTTASKKERRKFNIARYPRKYFGIQMQVPILERLQELSEKSGKSVSWHLQQILREKFGLPEGPGWR
jgi:hypothetical protein